jgi:hypothetical protein
MARGRNARCVSAKQSFFAYTFCIGLGVTIRFDTYFNAEENLCRVLVCCCRKCGVSKAVGCRI